MYSYGKEQMEGSKAFARYRDIDDEIARELVKMLE
jgi:hypothetical protein